MKVVLLVVVFFLIWRWTCSSPLPCEKCGTHTECKHSHGPTKFKRDLQVLLKKENDTSFSNNNTTNATTLLKGGIIFRAGIPVESYKNDSKGPVNRDFSKALQNKTNQDNVTLNKTIRKHVKNSKIVPKESLDILPINTQSSVIGKRRVVAPASKIERNASYIEQWNDALLRKREVDCFNHTEEAKDPTVAKREAINNHALLRKREVDCFNITEKAKEPTVAKREAINNQSNTQPASQNQTLAQKEEVLKINNIEKIKVSLGKRQTNITESYTPLLDQNKTVVKREQNKEETNESELLPQKSKSEKDSDKLGNVNHHYHVKNIATLKRDTNAMQTFDPKTVDREPRQTDDTETTKSANEEPAIEEAVEIKRADKIETEQEKNKNVSNGIDQNVKKMASKSISNTEDTEKEKEVKQFEEPTNITDFIGQLNFNVSVNKKECFAQIFVTVVEQNATSHTTTEFDISPIEESHIEESQNNLKIENETRVKRQNCDDNSTINTAEKETSKFRLKRELAHHRSPRSDNEEQLDTQTRHVEVPMNITIHIQKREEDQVALVKLKRSDQANSSIAGYANSTSESENKETNGSFSYSPNATKDHHHSKRDLTETRVVRKVTKRPKTNKPKTSQSSKATNLDKTGLPKNKDPPALKMEHKDSTKTNPPNGNKREYYPKIVSGGIRDKRFADFKGSKKNRDISENNKRVSRTNTSEKPDLFNVTTDTNTSITHTANHTVERDNNNTNLNSNIENGTKSSPDSVVASDKLVPKMFTVDLVVTPAEKMVQNNSETTKNVSNFNQVAEEQTTVERTRRFALWDESQDVEARSSAENHTEVTSESAPADLILLKDWDVNADGEGIDTDEYLDGYFKYAGNPAKNDMIQLNVNNYEISEKFPTMPMVERVKCTCAMYHSDPINKNENPTFAETVLQAPLGNTAADKDVLCTKSCGELAKAHLKVKQDVHCAHVKPDQNNFKEISSYIQNDPHVQSPELICCQVYTGEEEPTLQFVLSWLNIILLDVVVCLSGLGIVCVYLICFVGWRKREILPTYAATTYAVK